jgi:predicted Zn-dependent peptidase
MTYTDDRCPVVYINLAIRAGYRYETAAELGNTHFLEHILLKGTTTYPGPDVLAEQVNRLGGYQNASTDTERVSYTIEVAAGYAERMVGLLADMFANSLFDPASVDRERKVILEEYQSNRINHDQLLARSILREFFRGHPLGNSSLDADASTHAATPEILRSFKDRWYVPERSALVIGGGISHEDAAAMAKSALGEWSAGGTTPEVLVPFTSVHGAHLHIDRDIEHTKLALSYHMPGMHDERAVAAMRLISNFLGFGMSSLLARELRHKRGLVYMTSVFAAAYRDAGMFKFTSFTKQNPADVISVTRDLIERVPEHFRADDLEWVREQYLGAHARNLAETSSRTALLLDGFVYRDALVTPDEWIALIRSITYDDIVRATSTYLRRDSSMLTTMGRTNPGDL